MLVPRVSPSRLIIYCFGGLLHFGGYPHIWGRLGPYLGITGWAV